MLLALILSPLIGCFVLSFIDKTQHKIIQRFSLFWSLIILNLCFLLLFFFDQTVSDFQFIHKNNWLNSININIIFGLDGLGLMLVLLTAFLIPTCILLCWNLSLKNQIKNYCFAFFLLESILLGVFSSKGIMLLTQGSVWIKPWWPHCCHLFFWLVLAPLTLVWEEIYLVENLLLQIWAQIG